MGGISTLARAELAIPRRSFDSRNERRPSRGNVDAGGTDKAAYLCASKFAEAYCVTAALDHVDFESPVRVGDMVTIRTAVNAVGRSSMQVGLQVISENPEEPGSSRRTNRSFFTMVAVGEDRTPLGVPRLVTETAEDRQWRCEAELRREVRSHFEEELHAGRCAFDPEEAA